MAAISEDRRKSWQDLIENVDMTHNSKRAWSTIKKINNDPKKATLHSNVTADQVAHQLLLNRKPPHKKRHRRLKRQCGDTESTWQFTDEEFDATIDCLNNGKAAGLDDIRTEQIKNFGATCSKVAPLAVQQLCNPLPATQNMAQGSGYRHPETWERST